MLHIKVMLAVVAVTSIACVVRARTQTVTLIRNIVELSFTRSQCLMYVTDASYKPSWYVEKALLQIDAIFFQTNVENFASFLRKTPKCVGHVIVAANDTKLRENPVHHFSAAGDTGKNFRVLVFQAEDSKATFHLLEASYPVWYRNHSSSIR